MADIIPHTGYKFFCAENEPSDWISFREKDFIMGLRPSFYDTIWGTGAIVLLLALVPKIKEQTGMGPWEAFGLFVAGLVGFVLIRWLAVFMFKWAVTLYDEGIVGTSKLFYEDYIKKILYGAKAGRSSTRAAPKSPSDHTHEHRR